MEVLKPENLQKSELIFHKNDKKILSLLCRNVRLPVSKIARMLRLSRQSTEYRIKSMEKNHLIAGSRAVIDIKKLGYRSYHTFLNFENINSEKEFEKRCLEEGSVNTLISYSGKLGYEVSIMSKSPEEAKLKFSSLVENLNVGESFPCMLTGTIKAQILPGIVPENTSAIKNIKNDPSFSKQFELQKKEAKVDAKDREILYLLSENAQSSLASIGRKVSLTKDAVSYRIKNLIRGGYILQFRPVIDYSVLGLSIQAVLVKSRGSDEKFANYLKKNNSVLWATEIFGNWDYLIYVINSSQDEIHKFIKEMKAEFSEYIQNYEIIFAYKEHKYSFMAASMQN